MRIIPLPFTRHQSITLLSCCSLHHRRRPSITQTLCLMLLNPRRCGRRQEGNQMCAAALHIKYPSGRLADHRNRVPLPPGAPNTASEAPRVFLPPSSSFSSSYPSSSSSSWFLFSRCSRLYIRGCSDLPPAPYSDFLSSHVAS